MSKNRVWADLALVLAAAIWGLGFVPQRSSMEAIGPFTFNALRFAMGGLALLPLILIRQRRNGSTVPLALDPSKAGYEFDDGAS